MRQLTRRQEQVLDWIRKYRRERGLPPNRTDVAVGLGFREASSVISHLNALVKKGWIEMEPGRPRSIRILDDDLPLLKPLGEVAAGTPIVCDANIAERVPAVLAERFRPRPHYLLTVRGDSMDRTGLRDGDIVAVHRTAAPESGQVVVARFGDEVTLKRYVRLDGRRVELRPESRNPKHEVMELDLAKHILDVDGVAVGALIGKIQDAGAA